MAEARELPEEERSERSSQRENPRVSVIAPSLTDHDRGGSAISVGTPMALRLKGKSLMHLKEQYDNEERQSWLGRFKSALKEKIVLASFLAILGIIAALLKLGIDTVTDYTLSLRVIFISLAGDHFALQYFLWVLFGIMCVLLSIALTQLVAPTAAGSGIPEMKSILSGVVLEHYLSLRTLITKIVGLILALGGGLSIGKEGPYVHISSIVADTMSKLPGFRYFREHESSRLQLLGAACAVGISANFGAPIGGVLFSIEVTATYYLVANYKKAFFSAIWAALIFKLFSSFLTEGHYISAVLQVETAGKRKFSAMQLFLFVVLGIMCGLLGAVFVKLNARIVKLRRRFVVFRRVKNTKLRNWLSRLGVGFSVAAITGLLTFPGALGTEFASRDRYDQADLFAEETLGDSINDIFKTSRFLGNSSDDWVRFGLAGSTEISLLVLVIVKFFLTIISITLPLPSGVYTPVFTIGGAFGRLFGELLASQNVVAGVPPAVFALVGAASMAAGVTQTISAAVITFELTNSGDLHLPVLLATLIANAISTAMGPSIYDSLVQLRNLPVLGGFKRRKNLLKPAGDLVNHNVRFLPKETTYEELQKTLNAIPASYARIPIVDTRDSMLLKGAVRRTAVEQALKQREEAAVARREDDASRHLRGALAPVDVYFQGEVDFDDPVLGIPYSAFVFHLSETIPLARLHFMFSVLALERVVITSAGRLVGEVSKKDLIEKDL